MNRRRRPPDPVGPARREELPAAFRLFFQRASPREQELRLANALEMIRQGELDPQGVVVRREAAGLLGAILCTPVPGAGGLVWPPQVVPAPGWKETEDELIGYASTWLWGRGSKLIQALLPPEEECAGPALVRNGFRHITRLWYMRHELELPSTLFSYETRVSFQTYPAAPALFEETLLRTYEGTADCPEVNGVRTIGEVMEGHRSQGKHDPERWWLAFVSGRPVGVLVTTEVTDWNGWEVSYLGVVPELRRQGLGRELICKVFEEAKAAGAGQLTLSVDARNQPAWSLYRDVGFEAYDHREVYLTVSNKP